MLVQASTGKPTCTHTKDIIRDTQAYVDNPTPVPVHVFAYMCVGAHMLDIVHVGALHGMCVVGVSHATVTLMAHNAMVDKAARPACGHAPTIQKLTKRD